MPTSKKTDASATDTKTDDATPTGETAADAAAAEPAPEFVAVRDFSVGSDSFKAGDVVPPGRALNQVRKFGDDFVEPKS